MTVVTIDPSEMVADLGVCAIYAEASGSASMAIGAVQGLDVSPDGETVVFQLTDDFARLVINGVEIPFPHFPLAQEGIFVVRSDGTGLHRIADQAREAPFSLRDSPGSLGNIAVFTTQGFDFSPDGKALVFTDRGPGADGSDAPQLFTIEAATGARRQLTTFAASSVCTNPRGLDISGVFLDDRRVGGYVRDCANGDRLFIVPRDGGEPQFVEQPSPIDGTTVVSDFRVTGAASEVFSLTFPDVTDQPFVGPVMELFVRDGEKTLQLTNYGRSDTSWATRLRNRQQIVFRASADPLGSNPEHGPQIFRIDRLAGHLRQLTRFGSAMMAPACTGIPRRLCTMPVDAAIGQDGVTGSLIFDATCDPFGVSGISQQLYAIRPDGSGLRQLTTYRGVTCDVDGTVSVELPGPIAYSAPTL